MYLLKIFVVTADSPYLNNSEEQQSCLRPKMFAGGHTLSNWPLVSDCILSSEVFVQTSLTHYRAMEAFYETVRSRGLGVGKPLAIEVV